MMKHLTTLIAFLMCLSTQGNAQVSDEARAHIKCFANLSQGLFTVEMRKANPSLERQRHRHEELFMHIGRQNLIGSNFKFGVDHYLGGYQQRVYDGQTDKLLCDNPSHYGPCTDWVTNSVELLSAIGMKFYERENCGLLIK